MSLRSKFYSSFKSKNRRRKELLGAKYDDGVEFVVVPPFPVECDITIDPENVEIETVFYHSSVPGKVLQDVKMFGPEEFDGIIAVTVTESGNDAKAEVIAFTEVGPSFAIPDGVGMDPLAPTALAVSSEFMERIGSGLTLLRDHGKKVQKYIWKHRKFEVIKKSWKSIVNVVLVEAKELPDGPETGNNCVYCKFRLGSESHKTKQVPKTIQPTWRERFNLHVYDDNNLELTVWHKGRQKNFMGRCTIDLSRLEREKTHELWQELECGYGSVHLLVTLSATVRNFHMDNVPTLTNSPHQTTPVKKQYQAWYRLSGWSEVGQLSLVVYSARGLSTMAIGGKADAYCVIELDNSRVQTHTIRGTSDPSWGKSYNFKVNDITSTLVITVYDESLRSTKGEFIGRVSIPLLRINNNEKRWYALKNRSEKSSARGNCPRLLLEMSVVWNPIKASVRVLSPKEIKYIQKPPKFDIPLIYSNLEFLKDLFDFLQQGNEHFKRLFEWENREKSALALLGWLVFWYFIQLWMVPLLLLTPFLYYWSGHRSCNHQYTVSPYQVDDDGGDDEAENQKDDKTLKNRIYGLQDLTLTIKNAIDYIVSLFERLNNLVTFAVPYLSYVAITALVLVSIALYALPANYLFMALGIYKFTRKFLNPDRVPNHDLLDFISRVPDNEILKQWRELKVPEPNHPRVMHTK